MNPPPPKTMAFFFMELPNDPEIQNFDNELRYFSLNLAKYSGLKKRKSKLRKRAVYAIYLLALVVVAELVVRFGIGLKPGRRIGQSYFREVDSLIVGDDFRTDADGITKIGTEPRKFVRERLTLHQNLTEGELTRIETDLWKWDGYGCVNSYYPIVVDSSETEFGLFIRSLRSKDSLLLTKHELNCLEYINDPINEDGFRSLPFEPKTDSTKTSVFLIGDSFTFGHSAQNYTNSFADRLTAKGYICMNSGITCADPPQYAAIAKKYIPRVKPDVVIVNFYLGNDRQYFYREVEQERPLCYPTNAGMLMGQSAGVNLTAEESYNLARHHLEIHPRKWYGKPFRLTSLSTGIWLVGEKLKITGSYSKEFDWFYTGMVENQVSEPTASYYLSQIDSVCSAYGSKLIISVIPAYSKFSEANNKKLTPLFPGMKFVTPDVDKSWYWHRPDGHFHDEGHGMYADFLDREIKKLLP